MDITQRSSAWRHHCDRIFGRRLSPPPRPKLPQRPRRIRWTQGVRSYAVQVIDVIHGGGTLRLKIHPRYLGGTARMLGDPDHPQRRRKLMSDAKDPVTATPHPALPFVWQVSIDVPNRLVEAACAIGRWVGPLDLDEAPEADLSTQYATIRVPRPLGAPDPLPMTVTVLRAFLDGEQLVYIHRRAHRDGALQRTRA